MSQTSVATTVAKRAPKSSTRTSLHVVRSTDRAGSAWFPALCVTLLLAGLACVLALNTWMAHDSFEVGKLEERSAELAETEAALTQTINDTSAPQSLANAADDLGMVPGTSAAFIDVEKERTLGVATEAEKPDGINVDAAATATADEPGASGPDTTEDGSTKDAKEKSSEKEKQSSGTTSGD